MYRYIGCENLVIASDGDLYALTVTSPVSYETREDAEKDSTGYRITSSGGRVRLYVYPVEWAVTDDVPGIGRVLKPVVAGEPLATYTTEEFLSVPGNSIRKYAGPGSGEPVTFYTSDFVETDASFEDLLPVLEEGESVYVRRSETWYIEEV